MDIEQLTNSTSAVYAEIASMYESSVMKTLLPDEAKDKLLFIKHSIEEMAEVNVVGIAPPASVKTNLTLAEHDTELLKAGLEKILAAVRELSEIDSDTPIPSIQANFNVITSLIECLCWMNRDRTILRFKPFQTDYALPWLNACLSYLYAKTSNYFDLYYSEPETRPTKEVKQFFQKFTHHFNATSFETFLILDSTPISSFFFELHVAVTKILAMMIDDEFSGTEPPAFIAVLSMFHSRCFVSHSNKAVYGLPKVASFPIVEGVSRCNLDAQFVKRYTARGCSCYVTVPDTGSIFLDTRTFGALGMTAVWPAVEDSKPVIFYEEAFFLPADWLKYYLPAYANDIIVNIVEDVKLQIIENEKATAGAPAEVPIHAPGEGRVA